MVCTHLPRRAGAFPRGKLEGAAGTLRSTWGGRRKRTQRVPAPNLTNTFPRAPSHAAARTAEGGMAPGRSPPATGRAQPAAGRGQLGIPPGGAVGKGRGRGFTPPGTGEGARKGWAAGTQGSPCLGRDGEMTGAPGAQRPDRDRGGDRTHSGEAAEPAGAASERIPSPAEGEVPPASTRAALTAPPLLSPGRGGGQTPRSPGCAPEGRGRSPHPTPPHPNGPRQRPPPRARRTHPHARTAPARPGRSHLLARSEELPRTTAAAHSRLHCAGAARAPPRPAAGTGESVRGRRSAAEQRRQGAAAMCHPSEEPHGHPPSSPLGARHRSSQNLWGCAPALHPPALHSRPA